VKKQFGFAVAFAATIAGGGLALAQSGPPSETPPVEAPPADPPEGTPVGPPDSVPPVEIEVEETETTDTTEVEVEETDAEGDGPTDNHGALVSEAAHSCPTGPDGVHGECVSAVAQDNHGAEASAAHRPAAAGQTG
jgi:hypothetical protein